MIVVAPASRYEALCAAFTRAVLAGEEAESEAVARRALRSGLTRGEVYAHVMAPAMYEVGRRWALGDLTILEEHVATAITSAIIGRLAPAPAGVSAIGLSAVVACPAPEQHSLGARMFAETLREVGWNVIYVGASVPVDDLVAFVELRRPDLVGLSVGMPINIPAARELTLRLRSCSEPPKVLVGGYAIGSQAAASIPADAFSRDPLEVAALALRTVTGPPEI